MSLNKKLLEQLFLIEMLVHKINIRESSKCDPECECKKHSKSRYPYRVRIKFMNFPCVEINQDEFGKKDKEDDPGIFSCGKSFLFPMVPLDLIRAIHRNPLAITVLKRAKASKPPNILGVTQVQLTEDMSDLVRKASVCQEQLPISSELKDAFNLVNLENEYVGYIVLFVRLSCFGQSITTQFQMMDKRSYLFKNTREDEPYFCDKCVGIDKIDEDPETFDIVPVNPLISTSQDMLDIPCCELAKEFGDVEKRPVPWKMTHVCDCYTKLEDNSAFLGKVSDKHASKSGKPCSCSGRTRKTFTAPSEDKKLTDLINTAAVPELALVTLLEPRPEEPDTEDLIISLPDEPLEVTYSSPVIPHPPVRYDTTGALSPAFGGLGLRESRMQFLSELNGKQHPPVRYDATGALSPAFVPFLPQEQTPEPTDTSGPRPPTIALRDEPIAATQAFTIIDKKRGISPRKTTYIKPSQQKRRNQKECNCKTNDKTCLVRRFKPSFRYVYSWGTTYPETKFGHQNCVELAKRVPCNQGWMWNRNCVGYKYIDGWRPGAIPKELKDVIHSARNKVPPLGKGSTESTATLKHHKTKRALKPSSSRSSQGMAVVSDPVPMVIPPLPEPTPILHVARRKGEYFVAMHPHDLSGESSNVPLQFRIANKNKKKKQKEDDTEEAVEEEIRDKEVRDESSARDVGSEGDLSVQSHRGPCSTASSELDIEIFPPGTFAHREFPVQLINSLVQLRETDLPEKPPLKDEESGSTKGNKKKGTKNKRSISDAVAADTADISKDVPSNDVDAVKNAKNNHSKVVKLNAVRTVAWERDDISTAVNLQRRK